MEEKKIEGFSKEELQWIFQIVVEKRVENLGILTDLAMMHEGKAFQLTPTYRHRQEADLHAKQFVEAITRAIKSS